MCRCRWRSALFAGDAVAVAVGNTPDHGQALLFTLRSDRLRAHPSQFALPGGGIDPGETPEQAALRELHEELGIEADDVLASVAARVAAEGGRSVVATSDRPAMERVRAAHAGARGAGLGGEHPDEPVSVQVGLRVHEEVGEGVDVAVAHLANPERAEGLRDRLAQRLAGALEHSSEHPIAQAVAKGAVQETGQLPTPEDFANVEGGQGYFKHRFDVYGREGEPCRGDYCAGLVARIVQGGRSTFFCPSCQKR